MLLHWGEYTVNANELADKLEKPMVDNPDCPNFSRTRAFMEQVVAMLRQQQAEIEALKMASIQTIGTLKWSEDLLREAGHTEAVSDIQDCIVAIRLALRKAQEK